MKLGQLLSTRVEMMPQAYIEALTRLQDKVEPFSFDEVEKIVANELGVRLSKAFSEFDNEPMAAASLGQVHKARLRNGRQVAVKVQRPEIRERMIEDLDALEEIAEFLDGHTEIGKRYEFGEMLDQFRKSLLRELDYRQEASNLTTLREQLKGFDSIVVPEPIADYSTSRVLTMEYMHGRKVTDLSPLGRMEFDGDALAEEVFRAYLEQILVNGFFHADPHPGNVFLTDDYRIALIDLGMVGRIMPGLQEQLLQLLLAIAEGRGDDAADIAIKIGDKKENFDEVQFRRRITEIVAKQQGANVEQHAGRPARAGSHASRRREQHPRSVGADDARQNAAQSRSGWPHDRAGLRPERIDPPERRADHAAAAREEPVARQSLQRRARAEGSAAASADADQQDPRRDRRQQTEGRSRRDRREDVDRRLSESGESNHHRAHHRGVDRGRGAC